ncbi:Na-translocating system protein MpsC family protein [Heyndrickxia acidicola]|uniref:Na-translocating system protein MpsC family protein n=1 Tax=Heyndrickxia acidicola TaxID=209389 RepID=A0ABU6MQQ1_9BACI|nr:Na-translocating system protein MpsC family protein [Heyndrickxia acidicola]MED1205963.1 Na-translocating system protein MpsC family protein [Heyndrickxia acidicola]
MELKRKEKELGSFIGRLLREHYGKGPGSVFATISHPYIAVYIRDFMSPIENKLLSTEQGKHVQKIRDMMMPTITEEIKTYIKLNIDMEISDFYYDWNLDSHSGMLLGIAADLNEKNGSEYPGQAGVDHEIYELSREAEKAPRSIFSQLLNSRTLVITRDKILIAVEKELIHLGFHEALRLSKRNLEKRLLQKHKDQIETCLHAEVENSFVAWNFEKDKSVILLILKPNTDWQ